MKKKGLNFFRTQQGKIAKRLKYMIQRINMIMRQIQGGQSRWAGYNPDKYV